MPVRKRKQEKEKRDFDLLHECAPKGCNKVVGFAILVLPTTRRPICCDFDNCEAAGAEIGFVL